MTNLKAVEDRPIPEGLEDLAARVKACVGTLQILGEYAYHKDRDGWLEGACRLVGRELDAIADEMEAHFDKADGGEAP